MMPKINPTKKTKSLIIVSGMVFLLLSFGPIEAGAASLLIDDFESGDLTNWDTSENGWSASQARPAEGSWGGFFDCSAPSVGGYYNLDKTFSADAYSSVGYWVNLDTLNSDINLGYVFSSGTLIMRIEVNGAGSVLNDQSGTGISVNPDTTYKFVYDNIDYGNNQYDLKVYESDGTLHGEANNLAFASAANSVNMIRFPAAECNFESGVDYYIDRVGLDGAYDPTFTASGKILAENGSGIQGATVEVTGVDSTTSGADGSYSLSLGDGTHTIEASKSGFFDNSTTITISGGNSAGNDLLLYGDDSEIIIESQIWMPPGESRPYTIKFVNETSPGNFQNEVITDSATVTSNNTSVLVVNTTSNEFEGQLGVNDTAEVNATYQGYTALKDITVAQRCIGKITILPPITWLPAVLSTCEEAGNTSKLPLATEIQFLFAIAFVMMAAGYISRNGWVGIGTGMIATILLWVAKYVSTGILIGSIFFGIFLALALLEVPTGNNEPP